LNIISKQINPVEDNPPILRQRTSQTSRRKNKSDNYVINQYKSNKPFLDRMKDDISKRMSIDSTKQLDIDKARAFTRESERRDSKKKVSDSKIKIENGQTEKSKNYSENEWNDIYNNRFIKYKNKTEEALEKARLEKEALRKAEEEKVLKEMKDRQRKTSKENIDKLVNRMHGEAERRNITKTLEQEKSKTASNFYSPRHSICYIVKDFII
jgi:hypothetical protein